MRNLVALVCVIVSALLAVKAQLQPGAPWPKFARNAQNAGFGPFNTSTTTGSLKWKYNTQSSITSSPIIAADGTIYINNQVGQLFALEWTTGSSIWDIHISEANDNSLIIDKYGKLYLANNGYMTAFHSSNGQELWKTSLLGNGDLSIPAIGDDGTIYIGSDTYFYAIDDSSGAIKWQTLPGDNSLVGIAVGSNNTLYVTRESQVLAIDAANGASQLVLATNVAPLMSPVLDEAGNLFVATPCTTTPNLGFQLFVTNLTTGSTTTITLPDSEITEFCATTTPAVVDDMLYMGTSNGLYQLIAIQWTVAVAGDPTPHWEFYIDDQIVSPPIVGGDGTIYFGSKDSKIYAAQFDGVTLSEKWSYETGNEVASSGAIGNDGTIYFGSGDGYLYAFESHNQPCGPGNAPNVEEVTPNTLQCTGCPTAMHSSNGIYCTECTAGTYAGEVGTVTCDDCSAGEYSDDGAHSCSQCDGISYSDKGSDECDRIFIDLGKAIFFVMLAFVIVGLIAGMCISKGGWEYFLVMAPPMLDFASDIVYLTTTVFASRILYWVMIVSLIVPCLEFAVRLLFIRRPWSKKMDIRRWLPTQCYWAPWVSNYSTRTPNLNGKELYCCGEVDSLPKFLLAGVLWIVVLIVQSIVVVAWLIYWSILGSIVAMVALCYLGLILIWALFGLVLYQLQMLALPDVANRWFYLVADADIPSWGESSSKELHVDFKEFNQMVVMELFGEAIPQIVLQSINNSALGYWSVVAIVSMACSGFSVLSALYRLGYWSCWRGVSLAAIPPKGKPKLGSLESPEYTAAQPLV